MDSAERLQKILARAGFGSRRKCEDLIREGRVKIDGKKVRELGTKADPKTQGIEVDGRPVIAEDLVYYLLYKPKGVLCTVDDPSGRKTVLSYFPGEHRRLFPVGRLDLDSRGAVILTNDGALTQILTHPSYGVEKTYAVRVRGEVDDYSLRRLRSGIELSEARTAPCKAWVVRRKDGETELGLTLQEGRNRQVRRMLAAVEHKVRSLTRTRIGCLSLKGLAVGEARRITPKELKLLRQEAMENKANARPFKSRRKGPRQGKPDPRKAFEEHQKRQGQGSQQSVGAPAVRSFERKDSAWLSRGTGGADADAPVAPRSPRGGSAGGSAGGSRRGGRRGRRGDDANPRSPGRAIGRKGSTKTSRKNKGRRR